PVQRRTPRVLMPPSQTSRRGWVVWILGAVAAALAVTASWQVWPESQGSSGWVNAPVAASRPAETAPAPQPAGAGTSPRPTLETRAAAPPRAEIPKPAVAQPPAV